MGSKLDGIILPTLPLEKQQDSFTLDMHLFLQRLLRALKEQAEEQYPVFYYKFDLADDGTYDLDKRGIWLITADDGASYAIANAKYGSAVTLLDDSGNWVAADTDAKYCLIDQTTYIQLKNRIGAAKSFAVMIITTD